MAPGGLRHSPWPKPPEEVEDVRRVETDHEPGMDVLLGQGPSMLKISNGEVAQGDPEAPRTLLRSIN